MLINKLVTTATSLSGRMQGLVRKVTRSDAGSLRDRAIQGGGLLIIGDLYQNLLRLASNLVMTRLLYRSGDTEQKALSASCRM